MRRRRSTHFIHFGASVGVALRLHRFHMFVAGILCGMCGFVHILLCGLFWLGSLSLDRMCYGHSNGLGSGSPMELCFLGFARTQSGANAGHHVEGTMSFYSCRYSWIHLILQNFK